MTVRLERADDHTRLVLSGTLSVREAKALHATLCEVAPTEGAVVLDDQSVAGVDTSAIQLLVAFARARHQARRGLDITHGALMGALCRLGLEHELAPLDRANDRPRDGSPDA
jgi:ABC-type transporter Mla MlaB component